jgi:hypothetical protein
MQQKDKIKTWWNDKEVNDLELILLHNMFDCTSLEGVDVAYMYAKFMGKKSLAPDNYPIFLRLLETGNHWVIDALLQDHEPLTFFKPIQPNSFIITKCFEMLNNWKVGEIYPKLFLVILGILKVSYDNSFEGFRIYPLTEENVNSLGKHLDESADQDSSVNRTILHILDSLATITETTLLEDKKREKVASHANNIRGKFLDKTKKLSEAIPANLLVKGDYKKNEIQPSLITKK